MMEILKNSNPWSPGLPADQAQGYLNFKPSQKYEKDGDSYVYTSVTPSGQTQVKFQSGVAFDETNAGRKVSSYENPLK